MPQYIIHKDGAYNIFSTKVDAPYFDQALTLEELTEWYRKEHGEDGMHALPARLGRAHATGCSGRGPDSTLAECIEGNKAGEGETELSFDEFVVRYLTLPQREVPESRAFPLRVLLNVDPPEPTP